MVSATHHGQESQIVFAAGFRKSFDGCRRAIGGRIRIHQFSMNRNLPLGRDRLGGTL